MRRIGDGSFAVDGPGIERLLARYDIENEEALAHLERRLKGIGVLRALAAEGFKAGDEVRIAGVDFELDPRSVMSCLVVKLGSSIVADERGAVRDDVLGRICDEVAELHHSGRSVIVVTSGAIARGMGVMALPLRPRAIDELQAASAVGQGKLYQVYDELLRARDVPTAQVLLTFFDMSARTHYLNARQTLRKLLEWRVVPVINENDTTTTDEISFGNNDFLAAQVAILLGAEQLLLLTDADGVFTADPRVEPGRRAGGAGRRLLGPVGAGHRAGALAAGHGRDALQGGRRRDGDRGRDPDRDRRRAEPGHDHPGGGRRAGRARASRRARAATRASSCG